VIANKKSFKKKEMTSNSLSRRYDVKEFRQLFDCLSYADYAVLSPKLWPARKTALYTSKLRLKAVEKTLAMTFRRRDGKTSALIQLPWHYYTEESGGGETAGKIF
jgi:hypothetical protein